MKKEILKKIRLKYFFLASLLIILVVVLACANTVNSTLVSNLEKQRLLTDTKVLDLHFVNVGSADCSVIKFPNGKIALIDTGSQYYSKYVLNYLETKIFNIKSDSTIDYMFLSHADEDHVGGAWRVLNRYKVKNVVRPKQYVEGETSDENAFIVDSVVYKSVVDKANAVGSNVIFASDLMEFNIGEVNIKIFCPLENPESSNDCSYFIKISYKGKSILYTGDASELSEGELVGRYGDEIKADILKVGHHGASNSSSMQFLEAVKPKYAVISVGENSNGHPTSETLERLNEANVKEILRTDEVGNILLRVDENICLHTSLYSFVKFVEVEKIAICLIVFIITYAFYEVIKYEILKRNHEKR